MVGANACCLLFFPANINRTYCFGLGYSPWVEDLLMEYGITLMYMTIAYLTVSALICACVKSD